MSSSTAQRSVAIACPALPTPPVRAIPIGVLGREFMPVDAVGLASACSSRVRPSQRVHAGRNRLQVVGVNTAPNAAQVVELHSGRNRPYQQFKQDAMCPSGTTSPDAYVTVAVGSNSPRPQPTRIGELNLGDHSVEDRSPDILSSHLEFTPQGVMRQVVPPALPPFIVPDSNNFWLGQPPRPGS